MSLLIHGDSEFSAMITLTVFIKIRYSCTKYSLLSQVMATTAECSHHLFIFKVLENKLALSNRHVLMDSIDSSQ